MDDAGLTLTRGYEQSTKYLLTPIFGKRAFVGQSVREVFNQVGRGSEQLESLEAHIRKVALAPDEFSSYECV